MVIGALVAAGSGVAQGGRADVDRLLNDGHYLRAEKAVRAALQQNANDAAALSRLSVVDWSFNRLDASIGDAEKAVAAAPNSVDANSHLTDALGAKLQSSSAGTFEKLTLARRFRKQIDRTLQLDPNDVDALQDLAEFYWEAPGFAGGDKPKARQTADKLATVSPARAAVTRAFFLSDDADVKHRSAAIVALWRAAVAARPQDYDGRAGLAAASLEDVGDGNHLAMAEAEAKRARALDGTRVGAYSVLATVYARMGKWDELEELLKQARAAVPDDKTPQYRAAVVILSGDAGGQMPRAEQMLREYLQQPAEGQEPSHAGAHWRLGQALEKQGRKEDAVREYRTAVQGDGSLEGAKKDLKRLS